jgi:protease YdgD
MQLRMVILIFLLAVYGHVGMAQTTSLNGLETENEARVWTAIGRLDAGNSGFCSATLIAPDLVLTAAHCVYDKRAGTLMSASDMIFRAGLRNGSAVAERVVAQIEAHPGYDPLSTITAQNVRHDVALLRLKDPIPTHVIDPFIIQSERVRLGAVSVVSYGRGRAELPSRQSLCNVTRAVQQILFMDCNVTFGSSGAPVFSHLNGRGRIVSVISGMANIDGRMVSLGMELPEIVDALKRQMRANAPRGAVAEVRRIDIGGGKAGSGAKFVKPGGS